MGWKITTLALTITAIVKYGSDLIEEDTSIYSEGRNHSSYFKKAIGVGTAAAIGVTMMCYVGKKFRNRE